MIGQDFHEIYRRDGVVRIPGAFDARWVAALRDAWHRYAGEVRVGAPLPRLRPETATDDRIGSPEGDHDPATGAATLRNLVVHDESLWRFVVESPAAALVGELTDAATLQFWLDHWFGKERAAGDGSTPWHHDGPGHPFVGDQVPTLWIALTDVGIDDAPLQTFRGSHRDPRRFRPAHVPVAADAPLPAGFAPSEELLAAIAAEPDRIQTWLCQAGDALLIHPLTWHASLPQRNTFKPRLACSLRFLGDGARFEPGPFSYAGHFRAVKRLKPGDAPPFDFLPVVWQRPPSVYEYLPEPEASPAAPAAEPAAEPEAPAAPRAPAPEPAAVVAIPVEPRPVVSVSLVDATGAFEAIVPLDIVDLDAPAPPAPPAATPEAPMAEAAADAPDDAPDTEVEEAFEHIVVSADLPAGYEEADAPALLAAAAGEALAALDGARLGEEARLDGDAVLDLLEQGEATADADSIGVEETPNEIVVLETAVARDGGLDVGLEVVGLDAITAAPAVGRAGAPAAVVATLAARRAASSPSTDDTPMVAMPPLPASSPAAPASPRAADAPTHAYVDTPAGPVHVTDVGDGLPVVLVPWFPFSSRLYAGELATLASLGCRAIALDPLGSGRSGPRPAGWSVEAHAEALAAALAALDVEAPVLVGGHAFAPVVVELAGRAALGARAVVLDGGPLLQPEAAAALRARSSPRGGPGLRADGAHRTFLWDTAIQAYEVLDPAFVPDAARLPLVYRYVEDFVAAGMPAGPDLADGYPLRERMAALEAPGLVLSADTDPFRAAYEPMRAALPFSAGHVFAGGHPLHDPARAGEYARAVHDGLRRLRVVPRAPR